VLLLDVDVLVHAHRPDAPDHSKYRTWLESTLGADSPYGVSDLVLSGFLRTVTHPRVFREPTPLETALSFVTEGRDRPNAVGIAPGPRHWEIFTRFCQECGVRGNLDPDAWLAALAVESGCERVTTDRDFARFPCIRWRRPLQTARRMI
jgi:uncharacterized protein